MKLSNINRDYMVIIDVKSGSVNKPTMVFYNTDKNTSNIYAQLVVKETIVAATPIENATDYSVELKVVKPGSIVKFMDGTLVNEAEAIYEFDLPEDFTNLSGNYDIEFWVKAKVNDRDEMITSSKAKYTVKPSILTDLDEAIEDHEDYPLFLKLMEEVKVINETAHELDTTIRTLQSDMIDTNNEMKANEEQRKANEVLRETNEATRKEAERTRANQEAVREQAEATREANEQRRIANEDERKVAENQRKANEFERRTNENERKSAEASRVSVENARANAEEQRQTNEANREAAEEIRKANEEARITAETARVTEHEQMRTEIAEVKAENATLMGNDKKLADRMTQVEISDKRQYVIMEGLMNSAGDGYLKIEDTGNDTTLYNSVEGFVDVKNITGNTMVNSIKNPDDELTLNADINTSGQSVTLTTAVDNGQVDVLAEGNTMVNVCDQQEAVAITKSYTVETGNHVALQGEFDGKARPVPTGNTLVNLANNMTFMYSSSNLIYISTFTHYEFKRDTTYTIIFNNLTSSFLSKITSFAIIEKWDEGQNILTGSFNDGIYTFTTKDAIAGSSNYRIVPHFYSSDNLFSESDISGDEKLIILEGDYTNKPIPDYFTGMKSSFEDKVVTQEMVDSGEDLADNLGKYRVDYKVTGKNKFSGIFVDKEINSDTGGLSTISGRNWKTSKEIFFLKKGTYTISFNLGTTDNEYNSDGYTYIYLFDKYKTYKGKSSRIDLGVSTKTFTLDDDCFARIGIRNALIDMNLQLEEGSTATPYEPYKESIKTYYLNSPLLEGDTIEESGGNVYHVHRYNRLVLSQESPWELSTSEKENTIRFRYKDSKLNVPMVDSTIGLMCDKFICEANLNTDTPSIQIWGVSKEVNVRISKSVANNLEGFKQWLQSNPVTVVYKLASPTYELISQSDTILTDSYVAGHLDFDTAVPVEKVKFKDNYFVLKYLYPSTDYMIQFEADNIGKLDYIVTDNGIGVNDYITNKGINKVIITTGTTGNTLYMNGIGFNASNIVVTEATDKDFGYFSGMKSVGELEENTIEIVSANGTDSTAEGYLSNSKQILLNEPLRAVGDTKDRFVQIDGKWYVERNCGETVVDGSDNYFWMVGGEGDTANGFTIYARLENLLKDKGISSDIKVLTASEINASSTNFLYCNGNTVVVNIAGKSSIDEVKSYINANPITLIHGLNSPTYEPVEISPVLSTYTDVTHITNNSTIPMNMPIVNSGYEIIVKPSTKYTVVGIDSGRIGDSTIVNGTITTPATITDNFLRPYGAGKTSKVMLLEGEPANIPGYFKGIKSVFEDKVTEDGKYAVEVKVVGKNKFDINKITKNKYIVGSVSDGSYGQLGDSSATNVTDYIRVSANKTYIFSFDYNTLANSTGRGYIFFDNAKEVIKTDSNTIYYFGSKKLIFTPPQDGYIRIGYDVNFYNIQLEEGTVATEYEPYKETVQTLYLDEPLYNANNITIYNDKLGYWKNWDKVVLDGSENIEYIFGGVNKTIKFRVSKTVNTIGVDNATIPNIKSDKLIASNLIIWANIDYPCMSIDSDKKIVLRMPISSVGLTSNTIKQYLSQNPVTVVYQLAEPEFIPLIDNCPNWVIGSWDNCSIHFDSIIPLKDTRYRYTGNVPSVMAMSNDVATVSDISNQQDSMIIDLATQVATMEMMLM